MSDPVHVIFVTYTIKDNMNRIRHVTYTTTDNMNRVRHVTYTTTEVTCLTLFMLSFVV
jgi:hypothetical protein